MATEHNVISDGNGTTTSKRHEPKGASIAAVGQIYISDGASSGVWRYLPHSYMYYDDIGTGTTYTTPTAYTLIGPTTVGDSDPRDFSHNSLGRLTYTGTADTDVSISCSVTMKHSTGSGQDCFFQIHKNGSPLTGAQTVRTADSANYGSVTVLGHSELSTNDYFELYCKVASGNIIVHAFNMRVDGKI